MVRHIVCYKLKDPTDEVKQKTKEIFLSMQGRVPEVKSVAVGIDEWLLIRTTLTTSPSSRSTCIR